MPSGGKPECANQVKGDFYMYAIFDSRPQHSKEPFLFTVGNGRYAPAVYDNEEEAEAMAAKMNTQTTLTTFIVRKVR